jgi:hypothetical protein
MRRAAQSLRAREKSPLHRHYVVGAGVRLAAAAPAPSQKHQQISVRDSQTERAPSHAPAKLDGGRWSLGKAEFKQEREQDGRLKSVWAPVGEEPQTPLGDLDTRLDWSRWVQDEPDVDVHVPSPGSSRNDHAPTTQATHPSSSSLSSSVDPHPFEILPRIPPPTGSIQSSADPRLLSPSQSRLAYQRLFSEPYVFRKKPIDNTLPLSDPRFDAFVAYRDRSVHASPFLTRAIRV